MHVLSVPHPELLKWETERAERLIYLAEKQITLTTLKAWLQIHLIRPKLQTFGVSTKEEELRMFFIFQTIDIWSFDLKHVFKISIMYLNNVYIFFNFLILFVVGQMRIVTVKNTLKWRGVFVLFSLLFSVSSNEYTFDRRHWLFYLLLFTHLIAFSVACSPI